MINVTIEGFNLRFPNTGISSADVNSVYLYDAAKWVHGCLAEKFTVPFSDNNYTAIILTYQKAFHFVRLNSLKADDSDEMGDALDKSIEGLMSGEKAMVLTDDTVIHAQDQATQPGEGIWSSTMTYAPTFDEDETVRQRVDRQKIENIRSDRDAGGL